MSSTPTIRSNSPELFIPDSPIDSGVNASSSSANAIVDVLQTFQASLDKQLTTVSGHLESIGTRLDKLESRQLSLEEEVRASTSFSSSTSSPATTGKRKRVTPTFLQVNFVLCIETFLKQCFSNRAKLEEFIAPWTKTSS